MEKINVNLLPEEFLIEKKRKIRQAFFLRISAIVFVIALIITSSVLLIRLGQNQSLRNIEIALEQEKAQVSSLKDNESSVFVLKNRLDKINQLSSIESIPVSAYNLLTSITPTGANILGFTMSKDNEIMLTVETTNTITLDQLFNSLLDPKINKGFITAVRLENIRLQDDKVFAEMALGYNPKPVAEKGS